MKEFVASAAEDGDKKTTLAEILNVNSSMGSPNYGALAVLNGGSICS